ncbi:type IV pilin protein [Variovorax paradoxus]|uniref:Prepilin-type N-terminal cleavage/methylation domain-containing protein n=1 Tax=Variovorax paradoxus TaxID=34073 RepID=A0A6I6HNY5_VARPD|nr:type IV pilin protein [Variovorax paradoxus]QGW84718.1 prepilin-type N-terminal cleavage/methylation domain-containing protein [Variovorax paradoxus]
MRNAEKGFTLIELMITVAIVGILAAIAYPSYTEYVMRSRRVEGQNLLNDAAARQERFRAQNGVYAGAGELDKLKLPTGLASQNGYYTLTLDVVADDGGFTLKATRAGAQAADRKCGDFTLNAKGAKGMAADSPGTAATCWR